MNNARTRRDSDSPFFVSKLRPIIDDLYRFVHEMLVERIMAAEAFTCPHIVDRIWNRFLYPVADAIELPERGELWDTMAHMIAYQEGR